MYVATVALLMFILPTLSVIIESIAAKNPAPVIVLIGKWFVFWAVGVRLLTAGIRQIIKPELTARDILGITDKKSWQVVQELGFANLAIGILGVCSLFKPEWVLPAALVGGLFLGAAGIRHLPKKDKDFEENVATYSDLFIFALMAVFFVSQIT